LSEIVVDPSVALCWFATEKETAFANRLIAAAVDLVAPLLILVELANGLRKKTRRGEMTANLAYSGLREIWRFVPQIADLSDLAEPAMALARELDHSVYDCVYLALARRRGATLVTQDQKMVARLARTRYRNDVVRLVDWK
jgi:predicted nucleic acid-binding protein